VSSFTKEVIVSPKKDGKRWELKEEFEYYTDLLGERRVFKVPPGFVTDFASIPKPFLALPFITYHDKFNKAAVIHDWLYHTKEVQRKVADRIFLEGLLVLGIPKWKAYLFYAVVRLFGWTHWKRKNKKEDDKNENPIAA
jgi:hypothetical protein